MLPQRRSSSNEAYMEHCKHAMLPSLCLGSTPSRKGLQPRTLCIILASSLVRSLTGDDCQFAHLNFVCRDPSAITTSLPLLPMRRFGPWGLAWERERVRRAKRMRIWCSPAVRLLLQLVNKTFVYKQRSIETQSVTSPDSKGGLCKCRQTITAADAAHAAPRAGSRRY